MEGRKKVITGIAILMLCLPLLSIGQQTKFAVGPMASVDFHRPDKQYLNPYSVSLTPSFSIGIGVYFNPAKWFNLKTGVLYSDKTYTLNRKPWQYTRNTHGPDPIQIKQKSRCIDIPVMIGFKAVEINKLSVYPMIGAVTSIWVGGGSENLFEHGEVKKYEDEKSVNDPYFAPTFELGFVYKLNEKIQVGATPYYRHKTVEFTYLLHTQHNNSYGLAFDLRYNLGGK